MTIGKRACLFPLSAAGAICFGQGSISGKILTAADAGAAIPGARYKRKTWTQTRPTSRKLHFTERFRRLDLGHLELETTYDDPGAFKQPFKTREVHPLAPKDVGVLEYVCNENNRDVQHLVKQ